MRFVSVALVILIIFSGFGFVGQSQDEEYVLRIGVQDDLTSLNPFSGNDYWTWYHTRWIYGSAIPPTGGLTPYIAAGTNNLSVYTKSWDACQVGWFDYLPGHDNLSAIVYYDFEGVRWHDGVQMDIRDVMFSFHAAAQNPLWRGDVRCLMSDNYSSTNWLGIMKYWESDDSLQAALWFTLTARYDYFFTRTLGVTLLPEHIWTSTSSGQNVDGAKIWCDPGYEPGAANSWDITLAMQYANLDPVGSGLFMWSEYGSLRNLMTYRDHFYKPGFKYEDYCLDEYGGSLAVQPRIDKIMFKIYKTAEAATLALKNDDIDVMGWNIPPTFVQELANAPGIELQQSPQQGFWYLLYNMRRESFGYNDTGADTGMAFRKAVAHCIDKNRLVGRLLLAFGLGGEGPVNCISSWYNYSIPRYSFDPYEAKVILANAGYKVYSNGVYLTGQNAVAEAGPDNWWVNPDGSPIGSGTGGVIDILTPDANYDPIRAQAGLMIAQQLKDIGINAQCVAMMCFDEKQRIEQHDFDMAIDWCHIETLPPIYLYDFFHSDNVQAGLNYAGYNNASFDQKIEWARSAGNLSLRKQAIFDAQASICYDLPVDVLYYRTNIEAYRSDRYTGWVVDYSGSIVNMGSILSIRGRAPNQLSARFDNVPSAVASNSSCQITVVVRDQDGNLISGANILLDALIGSVAETIGTTDASGRFTTTYYAPYADPNIPEVLEDGMMDVIFVRTATYLEEEWLYEPAPGKITTIIVYPEEVPFLCVTMSADPDIIDPDYDNLTGTFGFTVVEVTVTNQDGFPMENALVTLTVSPAVPDIESEEQYTDQDGKARFVVFSTDLPGNNNASHEFIIGARAIDEDNPNYREGENHITIYIIDRTPAAEPVELRTDDTPIAIGIMVLCGVLAALGFVMLWVVRRREW